MFPSANRRAAVGGSGESGALLRVFRTFADSSLKKFVRQAFQPVKAAFVVGARPTGKSVSHAGSIFRGLLAYVLAEFGQHPVGALGMGEGDFHAVSPVTRGFVNEPDAR